MDILPAVDILDGVAVRLVRGDYDEVTVYDEYPDIAAARWLSGGAHMIHVVDLEAARGGDRQWQVVSDIVDKGIPIQLGGGIRTPDDAERAVDHGVARVVVGSVLVAEESQGLEAIVARVGPEVVVGAIDVRNGVALGHGWQGTGVALDVAVGRCTAYGIPRALVTGIEVDGTMDGPSLTVLDEVRAAAPDLAIIASGGVGSLGDIARLATRGDIEGVIVGRALYENRFTLEDAIAMAG